MFAVEVRDHIMIGHSLPAPVFGPAQAMHGATFMVDATFFAEQINQYGIVVDMGLASQALSEVLQPLRYKNLDEVEEFAGQFTTTEFLAQHIAEQLARRVRSGALDDEGRLSKLRVTLHESHIARAWYETEV